MTANVRRVMLLILTCLALAACLISCSKPAPSPSPAPAPLDSPEVVVPPQPAPEPLPPPPPPPKIIEDPVTTTSSAPVERRSKVVKNSPKRRSEDRPLTFTRTQLTEGQILVNWNNPMPIGKISNLVVRVEASQLTNFEENLLGNTTVRDTVPVSDKVKLVVDVEKGKFEISTTSPQTQAMLQENYVEWQYKVKPLKTGEGILIFTPVLVSDKGESQIGSKKVSIHVKVSSSWFQAKLDLLFLWLKENEVALKLIGGFLATSAAAFWAVYTFKKSKG